MKILFRKIHRWLGLLMALQIIAWMASGLYFSIFPIAEIRGEHLTRTAESLDKDRFADSGSPADVRKSLDEHFGQDWELLSARLIQLDGDTAWRIEGRIDEDVFTRLVQADGKGVMHRLTAEDAERRAIRWMLQPADIESVQWIENEQEDPEFRSRTPPAWKVTFSDSESLSLYLDPWTGELMARRTNRWRLFDFFWMLHIMDFDTRDDFNHPLLQIAAFLGLVVALTGIVFWAMTTRLFRRRQSARAAG